MIKKILVDGDERLLKLSEEVLAYEFNSKELDDLITDMIDTMRNANGVGISAVQIGVHKRVLLIEYNEENPRYENLGDSGGLQVVINPKIEVVDDEVCDYNEGCLSVPELYGVVTRPKRLKYTFFDAKGQLFEGVDDSFWVRVLQHEIDHLDGVLFTSRVADKSTLVKK